ncbi:MAG TPA: molybdate ABC transporter substrate-binding protein [Candidatus Lustribacter sp.]|jgi:molybdate transport system substrate-binding protein|nr:molybdate ABC transporter substrate-binding protein [Candidatus Lustribacter sp.]
MTIRFLTALIIALTLSTPSIAGAQSDPITLIAPGGIREAFEQLITGFEQKTGRTVKATYTSGLGTKQQVAQGGAFDVSALQPPYPEVLASGNVVANTATTLASVVVGVAVKKGAPKPDISTPDAVKRMLLAAPSISYPNPAGGAAAGVTFEAALKQLGIWDQLQPKLQRANGGAEAMAMLARGDVAVGVTFVSEMEDKGIDVVGILPAAVAPPTTLVGFVSAHAKDPAGAKALLDYLASPSAASVYKADGMQPGH